MEKQIFNVCIVCKTWAEIPASDVAALEAFDKKHSVCVDTYLRKHKAWIILRTLIEVVVIIGLYEAVQYWLDLCSPPW